jgi:hypothetical protein
LEQVALFSTEGFAPGAKAHPAQVGQFQCQDLDLGLGGVKFGIAASDLAERFSGILLRLINEFLNAAENPIRKFRSGVQSGQFSV